jgi:hypothetical protein
MEQPRLIYETLLDKRCSDSHWSKIKKLATVTDIPLDKDGLKVIINLRKLNPRYFNLYPEIQNHLTAFGETAAGELGLGATGDKLINLINNRLGISPDVTTIYRWFYRSGTNFKKSQWYDRKTAMMVLTNALIFKAKKQRIGA